jgi:hypothetical protein
VLVSALVLSRETDSNNRKSRAQNGELKGSHSEQSGAPPLTNRLDVNKSNLHDMEMIFKKGTSD